MKGRRILRVLESLLGIALFVGALWVLRRELREVTLHEIVHELQSLPGARLGASLALTSLGYLALTAYDLVALSCLRRSLPLRKVMYASFVGYALANNLPFAFLVGGSVRHRLYSRYGVSARDTAALVLLNILTYALGLATAAALAFTLAPGTVPRLLALPFGSTRPLGLAAAAVVLAYLSWSVSGRPLRVRKRTLAPLPVSTTLLQIAVSLADWIISGAALFVLLPGGHGLSYAGFFGVFLLAQIAALVAQLPGGLGVFEAVILATLAPTLPPDTVFGALLAYRVIYFLVPLTVAAALLGASEGARLTRGG